MHISVLSLHTSPVAQPGQGDAGGMNVYVDHSVRSLAAAGHVVDVFTADPGGIDGVGGTPRSLQIAENITLHHLPIQASSKDELADAIDELADLLSRETAFIAADLIWAHYWISAEAALRALPALPRSGPEIVVSMHTIGAVKNRDSDTSHERPQRLEAEERIASAADLLVANTPAERRDLVHELGADPAAIVIARPGVDHDLYSPGDKSEARARLGFTDDEAIVLYVGRMQFIKGTDVVVDALAGLRESNPHLAARTRGILLGAASGSEPAQADGAGHASAVPAATGHAGTGHAAAGPSSVVPAAAGLSGAVARVPRSAGAASAYLRDLNTAIAAEPSVEVRPPVPAHVLVDYYRAADVLLVPSRSESFGLVAAEAAASGLPGIASAVGGLPEVVEHGHSGVLIADHNPRHWATALERLLLDGDLRRELAAHAVERSKRFDWSLTAEAVLEAVNPADQVIEAEQLSEPAAEMGLAGHR